MFVPDAPRFRLPWLRPRAPTTPDWLQDPSWVPAGERQLYAAAKRGLAATLDAAVEDGDVALLPAYVPSGVVRAARTAGLEVEYYPVESDLGLDVAAVSRRLSTVDPDVLLLVHYFGFADPATPELIERARDRGALVVEDCARGLFGRDADGHLLGARGDVALFCPHKTLGAPNGGLLVSQTVPLERPEGAVSERRALGVAAVLAGARLAGVRPVLERPSIELVGSEAACRPDPALLRARRPGRLTLRALARTDPAAVRTARRERYEALRSRLQRIDGLDVLTPRATRGSCPFGVAARAPSASARDRVFARLSEAGLPSHVLTWPLADRSGAPGAADGARTLRERLLVLPTHQQVSGAVLDRVAATVDAAIESTRPWTTARDRLRQAVAQTPSRGSSGDD